MKTTPLRVIRRGEAAERAWLEAHGFDGLYTPEHECGCYTDDLYPCGKRGNWLACVPGHMCSGGIGPAKKQVVPGDPPPPQE